MQSPAPTDFTACPDHDHDHDTNYRPKIEFWHLLPVHLGEIGKGGSVRTPEGPRNPMARHLESIWRKVRLVLQNMFSVANRLCSTLTGIVTRQLEFSRGRFWLLQELTTWLQTTECRPGVSPRDKSSYKERTNSNLTPRFGNETTLRRFSRTETPFCAIAHINVVSVTSGHMQRRTDFQSQDT